MALNNIYCNATYINPQNKSSLSRKLDATQEGLMKELYGDEQFQNLLNNAGPLQRGPGRNIFFENDHCGKPSLVLILSNGKEEFFSYETLVIELGDENVDIIRRLINGSAPADTNFQAPYTPSPFPPFSTPQSPSGSADDMNQRAGGASSMQALQQQETSRKLSKAMTQLPQAPQLQHTRSLERVREHESDMAALRMQIQQLTERVESLQNQQQQMNNGAPHAQTMQELEEANSTIESLYKEIDQRGETILDLQSQIEQISYANQVLKDEYQQVATQLEATREELAAARADGQQNFLFGLNLHAIDFAEKQHLHMQLQAQQKQFSEKLSELEQLNAHLLDQMNANDLKGKEELKISNDLVLILYQKTREAFTRLEATQEVEKNLHQELRLAFEDLSNSEANLTVAIDSTKKTEQDLTQSKTEQTAIQEQLDEARAFIDLQAQDNLVYSNELIAEYEQKIASQQERLLLLDKEIETLKALKVQQGKEIENLSQARDHYVRLITELQASLLEQTKLVQAKAEQIESLQANQAAAAEEKQAQLKTLNARLTVAIDSTKKTEQELAQLKTEQAAIQEQLNNAQAFIVRQAQENLVNSNQLAAEQEQKVASQQERLLQLEKEIETLNDLKEQQGKEIVNLSQARDSYVRLITELQASLQKQTELVQDKAEQIESLQANQAEAAGEKEANQKQIVALEKIEAGLRRRLASLEQQIEEVEAKNQSLTQNQESLQGQVADLQKQLVRAKILEIVKQGEIAELNKSNQALRAELQQTKENTTLENGAKAAKIKDLEGELAQTQSQIAKLREAKDSQEKEHGAQIQDWTGQLARLKAQQADSAENTSEERARVAVLENEATANKAKSFSLEAQLQTVQGQLAELQAKILEKEQLVKGSSNEIESLKRDLATIVTQKRANQKQVVALKRQLEGLHEGFSQQQILLAEEATQRKNLEEDLEVAEAEKIVNQARIIELETIAASLAAHSASLEQRIHELETEKEALIQSKAKLQQLLDDKSKRIAALERELTEASEQNSGLNERVARLLSEAATSEVKSSSLQDQLQKTQIELAQAKAELADKTQSEIKIKEACKALESKNASLLLHMNQIEAAKAQAQTNEAALQEKLAASVSNLNTLQQQLAGQSEVQKNAQDQIAALSAKISAGQGAANDLQARLAELTEQLAKANSQNETLHSENQSLNTQYQSEVASKEALKANTQALELAIAELTAKHAAQMQTIGEAQAQLESQLQSSQAENRAHIETQNSLRQEILAEKVALAAIESEKQALLAEKEAAQQRFEVLQSTADSREVELMSIQALYKKLQDKNRNLEAQLDEKNKPDEEAATKLENSQAMNNQFGSLVRLQEHRIMELAGEKGNLIGQLSNVHSKLKKSDEQLADTVQQNQTQKTQLEAQIKQNNDKLAEYEQKIRLLSQTKSENQSLLHDKEGLQQQLRQAQEKAAAAQKMFAEMALLKVALEKALENKSFDENEIAERDKLITTLRERIRDILHQNSLQNEAIKAQISDLEAAKAVINDRLSHSLLQNNQQKEALNQKDREIEGLEFNLQLSKKQLKKANDDIEELTERLSYARKAN